MGLESKSLDRINRQFNEMGAKAPTMWWEYGTLWIDNPTEGELTVSCCRCHRGFQTCVKRHE